MHTPECPYCHSNLQKPPQRKTKCKKCGNYIFVRTHPDNREKVFVTEVGANEIDILWQNHHEHQKSEAFRQELLIRHKNIFEAEALLLSNKFGSAPKPNDVLWSLLLKERIEHLKHKEWGLFRNTTFEMAELLILEDKYSAAVKHLIDVCFLDIWLDEKLSKETGCKFSPSISLAPGIIERLAICAKYIPLDSELFNREVENRLGKIPILSRWKNFYDAQIAITNAVKNYSGT